MREAKYITFINDVGVDDIIVFSSMQKHSTIALALGMNDHSILGAGFITVGVDSQPYNKVGVKFECYGESTSLDIPSRYGDDSYIANRLLT